MSARPEGYIPAAGQTVWLACKYYRERGADSYKVEITGVQFR